MTTVIGLLLILAMTQLIALVFDGSARWDNLRKASLLVWWRSFLFSFLTWPVMLVYELMDARTRQNLWQQFKIANVWIWFGFMPLWHLVIGGDHIFWALGVFFAGTALRAIVGALVAILWLHGDEISREMREEEMTIERGKLTEKLYRGAITKEEFGRQHAVLVRKFARGL